MNIDEEPVREKRIRLFLYREDSSSNKGNNAAPTAWRSPVFLLRRCSLLPDDDPLFRVVVAHDPVVALEEQEQVDNPDTPDHHGDNQDELAGRSQMCSNSGRQSGRTKSGAYFKQNVLERQILQPDEQDDSHEHEDDRDEKDDERAHDVFVHQLPAEYFHVFVAAHVGKHSRDQDKKRRRPNPPAHAAWRCANKHHRRQHEQRRGGKQADVHSGQAAAPRRNGVEQRVEQRFVPRFIEQKMLALENVNEYSPGHHQGKERERRNLGKQRKGKARLGPAIGEVRAQLDEYGKADRPANNQQHDGQLKHVVVRVVQHGIAVQVEARVRKGADRGKVAVIKCFVPIGVIARNQEVCAQQHGSDQLDDERHDENVAHQVDQSGQGGAIMVGRNPDALLQADLFAHQHPNKCPERHDSDSAHLKEQRQKQNAPLVEHFVNRNHGQPGDADRTRCGKEGVDERKRHALVMK